MNLPLFQTYPTETGFSLIRTNRKYFRIASLEALQIKVKRLSISRHFGRNTIKKDNKKNYQSSSAAHVTQLVAELMSVIHRQIMAKVHTYPVHNLGTIYDFLHVKVKYLDNVENSKQYMQICNNNHTLSSQYYIENQENSVKI